jgi:CHAT domain-containing protein
MLDSLDGRFNVLHVASHFRFVAGDGDRSVLLPGVGDPIRLRELAAWQWSDVEMLVLSACDTATGGGINENGKELEGLAAAVHERGAQSVIASLWKVADASTAELMRRFYAERTANPAQMITRAQALQRAQLALLRGEGQAGGAAAQAAMRGATRVDASGRPAPAPAVAAPADPQRPWAHPFFWAPFVLSGNWL